MAKREWCSYHKADSFQYALSDTSRDAAMVKTLGTMPDPFRFYGKADPAAIVDAITPMYEDLTLADIDRMIAALDRGSEAQNYL